MPIETATPRFPTAELLVEFFRSDPHGDVSLAQAAELLGLTAEAVRELLAVEGGQPHEEDRISWSEAAAFLFDAWSRARIFEALGDEEVARRIPAEFRLVQVQWQLPVFVVRAMLHQAARDINVDHRLRRRLPPGPAHARGVDDYVADVLLASIEPRTLEHFADDEAFLGAYLYPFRD